MNLVLVAPFCIFFKNFSNDLHMLVSKLLNVFHSETVYFPNFMLITIFDQRRKRTIISQIQAKYILYKTRHVKSIFEYIEVFSKVSKLIVAAFPRRLVLSQRLFRERLSSHALTVVCQGVSS